MNPTIAPGAPLTLTQNELLKKMKLRKSEIVEIQLNRAITLFLEADDFVSSLTLAGASEEILGKQLTYEGKESAFTFLHKCFQEEKQSKLSPGEFSQYANPTRNILKHFSDQNDDPIEIFRWETIQMLMRAIANFCSITDKPTPQMKKFKKWLDINKDIYETLE